MDPLSDVLRVISLDGGVFLDAQFTAPWSVQSLRRARGPALRVAQVGARDGLPLRRQPATCCCRSTVSPAERLQEGDVVLLSRNDNMPAEQRAGPGRHRCRRAGGAGTRGRAGADPLRRRRRTDADRLRLYRPGGRSPPADRRLAAAAQAQRARLGRRCLDRDDVPVCSAGDRRQPARQQHQPGQGVGVAVRGSGAAPSAGGAGTSAADGWPAWSTRRSAGRWH